MVDNQTEVWWQNRQTLLFAFRTLTTEYVELVSSLKQVKSIRHRVDALASRADEGRGKAAISLGKLSS